MMNHVLKCIIFQRALWSDMFTGRLKSEIPHALVISNSYLLFVREFQIFKPSHCMM